MNGPDVTLTVVSYNTLGLLRECLRSVSENSGGLSVEVHVVDNASADGSVEMVRGEFPKVRIFENSENVGFAKANNQSWRESSGRYWLLLNSDAELKAGALRKLVEFADGHPKAGLVSARLENPDGSPQWCAHAEPAAWRTVLETSRLQKLIPSKVRGRLLGGLYFGYDEPWRMGYGWGTALLARREAVEEVGPLDESFWMYGEDVEWCLRMRRKGWEVWFCPEARVLHHGGQSSEGRWTAPEKLKRQWDMHYRALEMHRGAGFVRRLKRAHLLSLQVDGVVGRMKGERNPDVEALIAYLKAAI
jgi:hypothetical protein